MTGTWRAKLHADPKDDAITQVSFMVEDYVPERLDLTLKEGSGTLAPDETKKIEVSGRYLYGPPAAGLALEGEIVVKASSKDVDGYPGYRFGQADETVSPVRQPLEGLPVTGADGNAEIAIALPAVTKTARPLEADVTVRLREPGGRTIERAITLPVSLGEPRLGIKPLFENISVEEGEKPAFEAILLDAEGKRTAGRLSWELVRLDTSWQWYSRDGSWNYEAQTITRKIAERHHRCWHRCAGHDLGRRRIRPLPPRGELGRIRRPVIERHLQRRLVHERGDGRHPRDARCRPRQGVLRAGRHGEAAHRLQAGRQGARRGPRQRSAFDAGDRARRRAAATSTSRSATTGVPAPTRPRSSIVPMDETGQAHAEPRHRRQVDRRRSVLAHAQGRAADRKPRSSPAPR